MRRAVMSFGPPGGNPTPAHRSGWIIQRRCDAWQRQRYSSARCKMQKLSAERFHGRCSTNLALLPTNNNIEKRPECPLLAQSGHFEAESQRPLLGVKRTIAARDNYKTQLGFDRYLTSLTACRTPSPWKRKP